MTTGRLTVATNEVDGTDVRCYLTHVRTRMSSKGQIVLPVELRLRDGIQPGQEFEIEPIRRGEYRLKRIARRNQGLVQHLLACPVKDWFQSADRSETTENIEPPELG